MNESIIAFTFKDTDKILAFGGSCSWDLNSKRAMKCEYIVCARNSLSPLYKGDGKHREGFLIGKISGIEPTLEEIDPNRWSIIISDYAEINIPEAWDKGRNPIRYIQTTDLENDFGINFNNLEFKKVPDRDFTKIDQINRETESYYKMNINNKKSFVTDTNDQGLSIQEAKEKLAIRFGVTEDNIEIIIKG